MNRSPKGLLLSVSLILTLSLILSSCSQTQNTVGRKAISSQQISLENTSSDMATWQTNDLAIKYQIKDESDSFTISGSMYIKDSISYSFPIVNFLYLYINLLDPDGVVTSKHDITPNILTQNRLQDQIEFSKKLSKDADTTAFAFSYWGKFRERALQFRKRSDEWEIFFNPFEKRE